MRAPVTTLAAALLLAALAPPPGHAEPAAATPPLASLRSSAVVDDQVVRVRDLFENAGSRAAEVIGAAPAPGRRLVVEAPQLLYLARRYGVAWRPVTPDERAVIERPGRALSHEEVVEPLRAELAQLGMARDAELDLSGFTPPVVPLGALVQVAVEGANYDAATSRFAATVSVLADAMPTIRTRIAGRTLATTPVVVANRRMPIGTVLGPQDVRLVRMRTERVRGGMAQDVAAVIGQQLRRPAGPDLPIAAADLGAPMVVERNALVTMLLESVGLTLTAKGRALEAGPRGGTVPVMNLTSRLVVEGQVVGPDRVRVAIGTPPSAPDPLRPYAGRP